ncbi:MAG: AAA family ATPase [Bacteroidetes bacterium]|nr:AAA family ATPase [Bacteroidota bacterium]
MIAARVPKLLDKSMNRNIILYGPPGTGKTFSTISKAIQLVNQGFVFPATDTKEDRQLVKEEYSRLQREGKIAFVTFHQSLSYEDFIEGIKPKTKGDKVVYEIEDGLFKAFCNKARFISGNFVEVIDKFKAAISEEDGKVPLVITSPTTVFDIIYSGGSIFYVHPHNSAKQDSWYSVNIDYIRQAFEADSVVGVSNSTYVREVIAYLKQNYGLVKGNKKEHEERENYVMIIDEINRGNISQIFGELITLLETDKREGCPEALSATLPYSKLEFSVPSNVYIIGTMNTADRSVEALDSALRRRFSFEHMPPDKERVLVELAGIKLRAIFEAINERLEYLLDSDHQIGHSYFMKMTDESTIASGFKNEVIPLLKEYFYNDYGKLRLVLGDGLVKENKSIKTNTLFAVPDEGYITEKVIYYLVQDEDLLTGIKSIIKDAS